MLMGIGVEWLGPSDSVCGLLRATQRHFIPQEEEIKRSPYIDCEES